MRIPDGFVTNPELIIGSWIGAIILVVILFKISPELDNSEISKYATLGAYVFVVQTIPIPFIIFVPVPLLTLSGIALVVTIIGVRKGLVVSTGALILNHIFVPGALSMLGLNLVNMIITGILVGFISSNIHQRTGRRIRYINSFIAGASFILIEGALIFVEYALTHTIDVQWVFAIYGYAAYIIVLALIEGIFTGIAGSYYHRDQQVTVHQEESYDEDDEEISLIHFISDDETSESEGN